MAVMKSKCHPEYSCYLADFVLDGASFCFVARCGALRCDKAQGVVSEDGRTRLVGQDAQDIMRLASMGCQRGVRDASGRVISAYRMPGAVQALPAAPKTFVEASAEPDGDDDALPF